MFYLLYFIEPSTGTTQRDTASLRPERPGRDGPWVIGLDICVICLFPSRVSLYECCLFPLFIHAVGIHSIGGTVFKITKHISIYHVPANLKTDPYPCGDIVFSEGGGKHMQMYAEGLEQLFPGSRLNIRAAQVLKYITSRINMHDTRPHSSRPCWTLNVETRHSKSE